MAVGDTVDDGEPRAAVGRANVRRGVVAHAMHHLPCPVRQGRGTGRWQECPDAEATHAAHSIDGRGWVLRGEVVLVEPVRGGGGE